MIDELRSDDEGRSSIGDAIFVSQYFPPFNAVASQRALRMARVLLNNFNRVYVVTLPIGDLPEEYVDYNYGREELMHTRLRVVHVSPLLSGYGFIAKPRLVHRVVGALTTRILCSSGSDWITPLAKALKLIHHKARARLIVSTGGPFVPFLAVTRFAQRARIPCILDYRDLWSQNPRGPYLRLFRFLVGRTLERYVNRRCTVITTVSEGCRQSLLNAYPGLTVKTLMNTPDRYYEAWFRELAVARRRARFDDGELNIVLAGTVYPQCTSRSLVRAIALLPEQAQHRVKLHYFGPSVSVVEADFRTGARTANLVVHGYVSKSEALVAVKNADVLLSLVSDSVDGHKDAATSGIMTTKVFDYFLSGKPIINIGPPDANLNALAKQIRYDEFHSFISSDESALSMFLLHALTDLSRFRMRRSKADLPDFFDAFERILQDVEVR